MQDKGFIFISHAHQDVDLVRRIRNHFEELGLEPIMFYLKCLTDDDEITDLLKREISERDWFVYADSPRARESKWVRMEREEIKKYADKKVFTIDLDADIDKQLRQVEHIARQNKVYISYAHNDREIARMLRDALLKKDMQVWTDENVLAGQSFVDQLQGAINDSAHNGFVILIVTDNINNKQFVRQEIELAKAEKGKLIPVYIDWAVLPEEYLELIGDVTGFRLCATPSDEEIKQLVDKILHRVEYYDNDFRNQFSYRSAQVIHLPEITVIDDMTFWDCENLKVVYVPQSVVYITPNAFDDHPGVKVISEKNDYVVEYCKQHGIDCTVSK